MPISSAPVLLPTAILHYDGSRSCSAPAVGAVFTALPNAERAVLRQLHDFTWRHYSQRLSAPVRGTAPVAAVELLRAWQPLYAHHYFGDCAAAKISAIKELSTTLVSELALDTAEHGDLPSSCCQSCADRRYAGFLADCPGWAPTPRPDRLN